MGQENWDGLCPGVFLNDLEVLRCGGPWLAPLTPTPQPPLCWRPLKTVDELRQPEEGAAEGAGSQPRPLGAAPSADPRARRTELGARRGRGGGRPRTGPPLEPGPSPPPRRPVAAGAELTSGPGQTLFKVVIKSLSPKELVRIHVPKPLDRNDGTFLVRYRMYETVSEGLKIEVLYGDEHVAQSPYILKGPVYHEYCECPEEDPQAWQKTLSCPTKEPQIAKDFASFPSINLQQMLNEVPKRFGDERGAIVHYTILNNHIYRRSLGKYTDFKMFSDEILLSLARKVLLPDIEFYINLGDWPLEHRKVNESPGPLPIISWCGSLDSRDIILPTYDISHSTLEAMRGVTNDLLSIQGNTGPSWINKTEKAFFRGRDSREERLQLVQMSKENPELLDAGITGYFFFQEKEKELGKAKLIGFFDFFKYKYQVNVDGTVAAYRYPYLMLGDSLVLKQDSTYYEHFYMALKPWKHYVPIKRNLSDLLEKIKWAKENDEEAKKIAKEGQLSARDLLQPHRLYCYYYRVFREYAERQSSKPEIRDGMELVAQPDDDTSVCQCHRERPSREEL
ncbi:KDEL motif-containing protein 2 [Puma concolor]|uniref:KDEL motif-containing protein 2 n=1 Tax=Puma concolor TaxID=9696 RepID=A0A6P6I9B2_PUMCO|nr:KDEL motif-containing protein 2 [Puma concolor]